MPPPNASWTAAIGFALCIVALGFLSTILSFLSNVKPLLIGGAVVFALLSLAIGFAKSRPRILGFFPLLVIAAFSIFCIILVNSVWPN